MKYIIAFSILPIFWGPISHLNLQKWNDFFEYQRCFPLQWMDWCTLYAGSLAWFLAHCFLGMLHLIQDGWIVTIACWTIELEVFLFWNKNFNWTQNKWNHNKQTLYRSNHQLKTYLQLLLLPMREFVEAHTSCVGVHDWNRTAAVDDVTPVL